MSGLGRKIGMENSVDGGAGKGSEVAWSRTCSNAIDDTDDAWRVQPYILVPHDTGPMTRVFVSKCQVNFNGKKSISFRLPRTY